MFRAMALLYPPGPTPVMMMMAIMAIVRDLRLMRENVPYPMTFVNDE